MDFSDIGEILECVAKFFKMKDTPQFREPLARISVHLSHDLVDEIEFAAMFFSKLSLEFLRYQQNP